MEEPIQLTKLILLLVLSKRCNSWSQPVVSICILTLISCLVGKSSFRPITLQFFGIMFKMSRRLCQICRIKSFEFTQLQEQQQCCLWLLITITLVSWNWKSSKEGRKQSNFLLTSSSSSSLSSHCLTATILFCGGTSGLTDAQWGSYAGPGG